MAGSKIAEERVEYYIRKLNLNLRPDYDRRFMFSAAFGSHNIAIQGRITGCGWSDEGSFVLHVNATTLHVNSSVPRFWGAPLKHLSYNESDGVWSAVIGILDRDALRTIARLPDDGSGETERLTEEILATVYMSQFIPGELKLFN